MRDYKKYLFLILIFCLTGILNAYGGLSNNLQGSFNGSIYGNIPPPPIPTPTPKIPDCDEYNELTCPVGRYCEFDNQAEGRKEPGHCDAAFGLCFCVSDVLPPPPPPPPSPEEAIDCSKLTTPATCNGVCIFENIDGDKYGGHCTWFGDKENGGCDCRPDD